MADKIFDIESLVSDLTDEEREQYFPTKTRRSPNFERYLIVVNAKDVGGTLKIDIPKDSTDPEGDARDLRYNLNEAAKERKVWKPAELTEDEQKQLATDKRIARFERPDGTVVTKMKDGWRTEVSEPVVLRWKIDTKEVERDVTNKDGKTEKQKVKVPTRMVAVIVATTAIRHRARRGQNATTDAPAPTNTNGTVEGSPFPFSADDHSPAAEEQRAKSLQMAGAPV